MCVCVCVSVCIHASMCAYMYTGKLTWHNQQLCKFSNTILNLSQHKCENVKCHTCIFTAQHAKPQFTNKPATLLWVGWISDSLLSCTAFRPVRTLQWDRTVFVFVCVYKCYLLQKKTRPMQPSNTYSICVQSNMKTDHAHIPCKTDKPKNDTPVSHMQCGTLTQENRPNWKANMRNSYDLLEIFNRHAILL
jgi:hypothetical protein